MAYADLPLKVLNLGLIPYAEACNLQKKLVEEVACGVSVNTLLVCQHPAVITYGRRCGHDHILVSENEIRRRGIELCQTDRGGDVTYHGPGQAVFYPIFDLKKIGQDLHYYMRMLEEAAIAPLKEHFGLNAYRREGMTGVWIGPYKVGFIGIAVKKWVSYHGMSLNVGVDPEFFSLIKPCGLDVKVASINDFFSDEVQLETICDMIVEQMAHVFQFEVTGGSRQW
ncbi:lipoyl(octanoyl) transferase [Candidatus Velamenicoccus archaeovorus]|uniref:Octanoyltransferase n=1 Tax=Velamenicoccus archaeovorus TaxID=1930593 RepID=A0A410P401_VELA1|nr:lipoyl(octanoyl) transferase LipB [Candidatus Velamenicoccus archaeovorus]QAT16821.1 lipoyl(octanoyl) transferase [Candidatus Velamenicoccus archaeovorus]